MPWRRRVRRLLNITALLLRRCVVDKPMEVEKVVHVSTAAATLYRAVQCNAVHECARQLCMLRQPASQ